MPYELTAEEEADVHARVEFDLVFKHLEGNHAAMDKLSFKGVQLMRKPEWMVKLCEALGKSTTCKTLDLSNTRLTDGAVQQLAIMLAVTSRCPQLSAIDLRGNPGITAMGETVAQGLCRLRSGLEVSLGEGFDPTSTAFVHDKQLLPGLTAWNAAELLQPGCQQAYHCPAEIAGEAKVELKRGYQGSNGTKYTCDLATFQLYHQTGSLVLLTLASQEGVEV